MYESQRVNTNLKRRNFIFSQRGASIQNKNNSPQLQKRQDMRSFLQPDKIVQHISLSRSKQRIGFNQRMNSKDHSKVITYGHYQKSPSNYKAKSPVNEDHTTDNQHRARLHGDFSHIQFVNEEPLQNRKSQAIPINRNYNFQISQNKAKLPIKDKTILQQTAQLNIKNTLVTLKNLLIHNQQKVLRLQSQLASIHSSLLRMYNQHQAQLKAKVSMRCQQFVSMMRKMMSAIKIRQQYTVKVDDKVALFSNTLKNVSQKLRIISIKQDCIEVIANRSPKQNDNNKNAIQLSVKKQQSQNKQRPRNSPQRNQKVEPFKRSVGKGITIEDSGVYNFEQFEEELNKDHQLSSFWRNSSQKLNSTHKQSFKPVSPIQKKPDGQKLRIEVFMKQQYRKRPQNDFQNFKMSNKLQSARKAQQFFQNEQQLDRVSPFQTNQMIRNSVSLPLRMANHIKPQDRQDLQYFKLQQPKKQQIPLNQDFQTFNRHNSYNSYKSNLKRKSNSKLQTSSVQKTRNSLQKDKHRKKRAQVVSYPSAIQRDQHHSFQIPNKANRNQSNDKYDIKMKSRIQQLTKLLSSPKTRQNPVKYYLDQLGCLRRANHTYLFEQNGNLVMLTVAQFQQLINQGVIKGLGSQQ